MCMYSTHTHTYSSKLCGKRWWNKKKKYSLTDIYCRHVTGEWAADESVQNSFNDVRSRSIVKATEISKLCGDYTGKNFFLLIYTQPSYEYLHCCRVIYNRLCIILFCYMNFMNQFTSSGIFYFFLFYSFICLNFVVSWIY